MKKRVKAFVGVQYPKSKFPHVATFYCTYYRSQTWSEMVRANRTDDAESTADVKKRLMKSGWRVLPCYIEVEL